MNGPTVADSRTIRLATSFGFGLVLALTVVGCGESNGMPNVAVHPVKGNVKLGSGGAPAGAHIIFVAQTAPGLNATGEIAADGGFELTTKTKGDGATAGDYKIRFDDPPVAGKDGQRVKSPIAPKYHDEGASGLSYTVKAGSNDVPPITLK